MCSGGGGGGAGCFCDGGDGGDGGRSAGSVGDRVVVVKVGWLKKGISDLQQENTLYVEWDGWPSTRGASTETQGTSGSESFGVHPSLTYFSFLF